jgi:hypothetical protein
MVELAVTAAHPHQEPAVVFKQSDQLFDFHSSVSRFFCLLRDDSFCTARCVP